MRATMHATISVALIVTACSGLQADTVALTYDVQYSGTVSGFKGASLALTTGEGLEIRFPIVQVRRITMQHRPVFNLAETACSSKSYREAIQRYDEALRSAKTPWLRQLLSSRRYQARLLLAEAEAEGLPSKPLSARPGPSNATIPTAPQTPPSSLHIPPAIIAIGLAVVVWLLLRVFRRRRRNKGLCHADIGHTPPVVTTHKESVAEPAPLSEAERTLPNTPMRQGTLQVWFYDDDTAFCDFKTASSGQGAFIDSLVLWSCFANRQLNNMGKDASSLATLLAAMSGQLPAYAESDGQGPRLLSHPPKRGQAGKHFKGTLSPLSDAFFRFHLKMTGFGILGKGLPFCCPVSVILALRQLVKLFADRPDYVKAIELCATTTGESCLAGGLRVTNGDKRALIQAVFALSALEASED
jgi:hypothetical protein